MRFALAAVFLSMLVAIGAVAFVFLSTPEGLQPNSAYSDDGARESEPVTAEPGDEAEEQAEFEAYLASYEVIPKVDVHVHLPPTLARPAMALFRRHNIVMAINASGGSPGRSLPNSVLAGRAAGGLYAYCFVNWRDVGTNAWRPRAFLEACKEEGAVGVKISKGLGLGYLVDGELLRVDDERLDEAFEAMGNLGLPVLIHTGDPRAFFDAPTENNERFEELSAHPSWSFHGERPDGGQWPSWQELLDQFEARVSRHPNTTFIGAHFGNAPEEPDYVARLLRENDNLYIETGARVPEIGRHDPAQMRAFFIEFQDRILFGTDFQAGPGGGLILGSVGRELDTLERVPAFYESHWRYFETNDENFEHPSPIQGDWTIDGLGLPREVLLKVYQQNALRVFGLTLPE